MLDVTVAQAAESLRKIYLHNQNTKKYKLTPFLWGPPGVGKSAVMQQLANEFDAELIDLRLATMSILDLRGVPFKNERDGVVQTDYARPSFVPTTPGKLLFLDELPSAPPVNQAGAYEICLDYRVGSHPVHPDTFIVLAGNRQEDRGVVYEMPVPLRNRLIHFNIVPHLDTFIDYGLKSGLNESVLAFLKFKPNLLYAMPKGSDNSFPTPRSWEYLSSLLPYEPNIAEMSGIVGEGVASEFNAFLRLRNELPDIAGLLRSGKAWTTEKIDLAYAFVFSLSTHYKNMMEAAGKDVKERAKITENYISLVAAQPEEMMILSFYLIKGTPVVMDVYRNKRYMDEIVNKIKDVLKQVA